MRGRRVRRLRAVCLVAAGLAAAGCGSGATPATGTPTPSAAVALASPTGGGALGPALPQATGGLHQSVTKVSPTPLVRHYSGQHGGIVAEKGGVASPTSDPVTGAPAWVMDVSDSGFSPSSVTILQTTELGMKNVGSIPHSWVSASHWDSGPIAPGDTYWLHFTYTGTFQYDDGLHPSLVGTVTVQASS